MLTMAVGGGVGCILFVVWFDRRIARRRRRARLLMRLKG